MRMIRVPSPLSGLQPQEFEELVDTYDQILLDLDIERSSPLAQAIAKELIGLSKRGVRTRKELAEVVMEEFG
jgi:hypothetical protein